jgi:putative addiction module component (TIGR02574 family)
MTTDQLERELLKLPAAGRARLAERLIASLDEDPDVEAAWKTEVRRRDAEVESGALRAIPVEDALRTTRAKFGWKSGESVFVGDRAMLTTSRSSTITEER